MIYYNRKWKKVLTKLKFNIGHQKSLKLKYKKFNILNIYIYFNIIYISVKMFKIIIFVLNSSQGDF